MPGIPPRSVRHLLQPQHTPGQSPYECTPPPKPNLASTQATPQPTALYVFEDWSQSPSAQSSHSCGVPTASHDEPAATGAATGSSSEAAAAGSCSSEVDELRERVTALGAALEAAEKRGALLARQKQRLQEQVQRLQSQPPTPQPVAAVAAAVAAAEEEEERAAAPTRLPAELGARLQTMATSLVTHRERLVLEVGALRARAEAAERAAADAQARAASREGAHRGAAAPSPAAPGPAAATGEHELGSRHAPDGLAHWWDSFGSEYGGEEGRAGEAGAAGSATPCGTGGLTTPSAASWSGRSKHGSGAVADGDAWSSPEVWPAPPDSAAIVPDPAPLPSWPPPTSQSSCSAPQTPGRCGRRSSRKGGAALKSCGVRTDPRPARPDSRPRWAGRHSSHRRGNGREVTP